MESTAGDRIAEAARALIGTRYRRQGCTVSGVDCVGVVILALAGAGRHLRVEERERLRFKVREDVEARLRSLGFAAVEAADRRTGDVVLTEPASGQLHFMIVTPAGVVEAHAGLRRVVERPWRSDERILSTWRAA